jgi:hypothetical protein
MTLPQFPDGRTVTVFYPTHNGVAVTDAYLSVHGRRYAVSELTGLGWRRGPVQLGRWIVAEIVLLEAALVATVVLVAGVSLPALAAGAAYILSACAVLAFSIHRWPTPLRLCGQYRGRQVVLFTSTDHIEFQKVNRALRRAMELQELPL